MQHKFYFQEDILHLKGHTLQLKGDIHPIKVDTPNNKGAIPKVDTCSVVVMRLTPNREGAGDMGVTPQLLYKETEVGGATMMAL